jgi:hypothetical protein
MKQLIDLLRQIGDAAPDRPGRQTTAATAREAADRLFRGVVALSSAVGAEPGSLGEAEEDVAVLEPAPPT